MSRPLYIETLCARPETAIVIAGWLFSEWGRRNPLGSLGAANERVREQANERDLPICWVGFEDGVPVATASLAEREDDADEPGPWLSSVFTVPRARGQGHAQRLIHIAEQRARSLGFKRILLSAAVPRLYERLGWSPTGSTKNGEPVMLKALAR